MEVNNGLHLCEQAPYLLCCVAPDLTGCNITLYSTILLHLFAENFITESLDTLPCEQTKGLRYCDRRDARILGKINVFHHDGILWRMVIEMHLGVEDSCAMDALFRRQRGLDNRVEIGFWQCRYCLDVDGRHVGGQNSAATVSDVVVGSSFPTSAYCNSPQTLREQKQMIQIAFACVLKASKEHEIQHSPVSRKSR